VRPLVAPALILAGLELHSAVGVAVQPPQDVAQRPTFRSSVDVVAFPVAVNRGVTPVTDLQASDFRVVDDGVAQQVTELSYGKLPIDVTAVLDVSFSMVGPGLERLQEGIGRLTTLLGPGDRLRLLAFNQNVRQVVDFTADSAVISHALRNLVAGGGTAIFDALTVAMLTPTDLNRRQFVILVTDGADGLSVTEPRDLVEAARRSQASVSAIVPCAAALVVPVGRLCNPATVSLGQLGPTASGQRALPRRPRDRDPPAIRERCEARLPRCRRWSRHR